MVRNGINALIKETPEISLVSSTMWGHWEERLIYEQWNGFSTDAESPGALILGFLAFRTVGNKHLLFITQFMVFVLYQLRWTKMGFPCGSAGKKSICNVGDLGSILGLGRSPGEVKGYPLQYSSLENSMDCVVHGVTKSRTQLSDFHFLPFRWTKTSTLVHIKHKIILRLQGIWESPTS